MKKNKIYVGIDISKLTFDVAINYEDNKYKHYKFSNDLKGFKEFKELLSTEYYVCVMEASGPYYLKLATYLFNKSIAVCVVNPLVIKRFCQMRMTRTKTDKKDSIMISAYGKTERPSFWKPEPDYVLELKQMLAYLEQLEKSKTGFVRQIEAFNQNTLQSKTLKKSIKSTIKKLDKEIAFLETEMETIIKKYHNDMYHQIKSIPGLGKKATLLLIVISGGFTKFETSKQLASYVGIAPRIFESGTSVKGRARICKMGMSKIRAVLYVCSWSAKKYNKTCRDLYNRLIKKGKSKKLALVAVMNKLLKQAFAIATKKEFYVEIYTN